MKPTRISETSSRLFTVGEIVHHEEIDEFKNINGGDWNKELNPDRYEITRTVKIAVSVRYYD